MKYVYIYCEGQTEESFVNDVLYPYFFKNGYLCYTDYTQDKENSDKGIQGRSKQIRTD